MKEKNVLCLIDLSADVLPKDIEDFYSIISMLSGNRIIMPMGDDFNVHDFITYPPIKLNSFNDFNDSLYSVASGHKCVNGGCMGTEALTKLFKDMENGQVDIDHIYFFGSLGSAAPNKNEVPKECPNITFLSVFEINSSSNWNEEWKELGNVIFIKEHISFLEQQELDKIIDMNEVNDNGMNF